MVNLQKERSETTPRTMVVVCAWCHRQRVIGPDLNLYWIEVEGRQGTTHVSHTICPTCKTKISGQLKVDY
ncbi:hypothetical protein ACX8XP_02285 [Calditrichota bacterium LG25]